METATSNPSLTNLIPETTPKNYAQPNILCQTFNFLSNLHKLLPSNMVEMLHSYRSESDKIKCENGELSGLEKILERHKLPKEVSLTPKPNKMPSWKRKMINNISDNCRKCHFWKENTYEPPMCTVVARWSKKNLKQTEDFNSVVKRLSAIGPIISATPCGRESVVVVFKDISSACKAVNAFPAISASTMFQCSWQHQFMSKKVRLSIAKNLI
ncbi:uncharacterized protein C6orf201 homolog [Cricetulus griseus]|uniref:Uncharacterized protein C6orf201 homolog n=1 Tax=Cricetulus griseus TaxID=10029 RepID=A0A9J7JIK2_CRIGR|nr:uncharacterized protein C6orf201 homolog [Cricetulus griseus]XP_027265038.1 uncharacterized protein C6orf201 homolog [Cricetulus griseus]